MNQHGKGAHVDGSTPTHCAEPYQVPLDTLLLGPSCRGLRIDAVEAIRGIVIPEQNEVWSDPGWESKVVLGLDASWAVSGNKGGGFIEDEVKADCGVFFQRAQ